MSEIGEIIKKLRGNDSLREASKKIGISHTYLDTLEKGFDKRSKVPVKPSPDTLRMIATAYNYSYEELMIAAGYIDDGLNKDKDHQNNTPINIAFRDGGEDITEEEAEFLEQQLKQFREWRKKFQQDK